MMTTPTWLPQEEDGTLVGFTAAHDGVELSLRAGSGAVKQITGVGRRRFVASLVGSWERAQSFALLLLSCTSGFSS